eukprot:GHVL01031731.1.p1 GENE.GHVL01031731.1~~GHVL01031731.1.p1  ORF type:complete len:637 (-),score=79.67 GHVL01031731.1:3337-5247(-)
MQMLDVTRKFSVSVFGVSRAVNRLRNVLKDTKGLNINLNGSDPSEIVDNFISYVEIPHNIKGEVVTATVKLFYMWMKCGCNNEQEWPAPLRRNNYIDVIAGLVMLILDSFEVPVKISAACKNFSLTMKQISQRRSRLRQWLHVLCTMLPSFLQPQSPTSKRKQVPHIVSQNFELLLYRARQQEEKIPIEVKTTDTPNSTPKAYQSWSVIDNPMFLCLKQRNDDKNTRIVASNFIAVAVGAAEVEDGASVISSAQTVLKLWWANKETKIARSPLQRTVERYGLIVLLIPLILLHIQHKLFNSSIFEYVNVTPTIVRGRVNRLSIWLRKIVLCPLNQSQVSSILTEATHPITPNRQSPVYTIDQSQLSVTGKSALIQNISPSMSPKSRASPTLSSQSTTPSNTPKDDSSLERPHTMLTRSRVLSNSLILDQLKKGQQTRISMQGTPSVVDSARLPRQAPWSTVIDSSRFQKPRASMGRIIGSARFQKPTLSFMRRELVMSRKIQRQKTYREKASRLLTGHRKKRGSPRINRRISLDWSKDTKCETSPISNELRDLMNDIGLNFTNETDKPGVLVKSRQDDNTVHHDSPTFVQTQNNVHGNVFFKENTINECVFSSKKPRFSQRFMNDSLEDSVDDLVT